MTHYTIEFEKSPGQWEGWQGEYRTLEEAKRALSSTGLRSPAVPLLCRIKAVSDIVYYYPLSWREEIESRHA